MNVEAFIAEVLDRLPLPVVGRAVENIAMHEPHSLRAKIKLVAWHHDAVEGFIGELAERLIGPVDIVIAPPRPFTIDRPEPKPADDATLEELRELARAIYRVSSGDSSVLDARQMNVIAYLVGNELARRELAAEGKGGA